MPGPDSKNRRFYSTFRHSIDSRSLPVPNNIFRFRKLKWGDPERPWLRRGAPQDPSRAADKGSWLDSPWVIGLGAILAFGLGWLLFVVGS